MNTDLIINNNTDLFKIIHDYLENNSSLNFNKVEYSNELQKISICFKGAIYKSSISSNTMKAFLQLQDAIYSLYSIYMYGEKRRLNIDTRRALELNVIVEEGSSKYFIDLAKITEALCDRIKASTEKELTRFLIIASVTILAITLGSKVLDHKTEIDRMNQYSNTLTGVQKNTAEAISEVLQSQQSFYRIISSQNFETLEINNQLLTQDELIDMVKIERVKYPIESKIYSGKYKITAVHFDNDANKLDIICDNELIIKGVNILEGIISADNYQWFKDSASGKEVEMTVIAAVKNGEIIASYLHDFSIPKN